MQSGFYQKYKKLSSEHHFIFIQLKALNQEHQKKKSDEIYL